MSTPTTTCLLQGALTLTSTPSEREPPQAFSLPSSLPNATTILLSPSPSPSRAPPSPSPSPSPSRSASSSALNYSSPVPIPSTHPDTATDRLFRPFAPSSYGATAQQSAARPPLPTQKSVLPPPTPPSLSPFRPTQKSVLPPPPPYHASYASTPASTARRGAEAEPLLRKPAPRERGAVATAWDALSSSALWPRLLLLFVAAVWGTNFPTVKILQTPPDPLSAANAALARFVLATGSLLPFTLNELRALGGALPPAALLGRGLLSGLPVFVGYLTQAVALTRTDAGKCAFMCSLAVVVVPLLTRLIPALAPAPDVEADGGETESKSKLSVWGAPILAVAGVALLELAGASPPNVGDVWAGAQAVGFAIGFIVNERMARDFPEHPLTITTVQLGSVALLSLGWATGEAWLHAGHPTWPALGGAVSTQTNASAVVYAGVVSTALTLWITMRALRRVSAGELAVLLSTEPMWAAALAAVALGERMGPGAVLGGALILLACVVNQAESLGLADWAERQEARVGDGIEWVRAAVRGAASPRS